MDRRGTTGRMSTSSEKSPRVRTDEPGQVAVAELPDVAEPFIVAIKESETERAVYIIDVQSGGRVVTTIELSPSNKRRAPSRSEDLGKQGDMRAGGVNAGGVNIVDIDLLRTGEHTTLARVADIPPTTQTPYHASVYRADGPNRLELLPNAAARATAAAARPPSIHGHRCRARSLGRRRPGVRPRALRRHRLQPPPIPPLSPDDAAWAGQLLRAPAQPAQQSR